MIGTARSGFVRTLLCLIVGLLVIGTSPAAADPTSGPELKTPLPVSVQFVSISPTISVGDEPIQIQATLTNTGQDAITEPWIRLQRDQRVSTRAQLQEIDSKQPSYTAARGKEQDLDSDLEPGASVTVQLSVPRTELGISDSGAYPILLNVQGSIDGVEGRVGQGAFTMPRTATATAPPVTVSWVLPLIDRPHRMANPDVFSDDDLAGLIADGGRLDVLLRAAEKYAATTDLTLVIDPELVDSLVDMSDGYQVSTTSGIVDGTAADRAAKFLTRLRALVNTTPVIATAYADVDTVALVRAGLTSVATDARAYGDKILSDALEVTPITTIDWPADGAITDAAAQVLAQAGVDTLLLGGSAFGQDDYLESADGITENAATTLPTGRAVVSDPALTRILADSSTYTAGPVAATQRLAAELAMVAAQAPQRERNVLLTPPRQWNPSEQLIDDLLELTADSDWIHPAYLSTIAQSEPQNRGALVYPSALSAQELPGSSLAALQPTLTQITELSTAFEPEDAAVALWPAWSGVLRASSSAWRGGDGQQVSTGAAAADAQLAGIRSQIRIVTPSGGTYTLASSDAPLVFTVENDLPWQVHYRIGVDATRSAGLTTEDIGVQTIAAGTRATVQLPTTVERSGTFTVVAQISTPEGNPLGNDVQIKVYSSAYGTFALWVTGIAFTLLLALIARRWWRRHLFWADERRKRAAAEEHQRLEESGAL